MTRHNHHRTMTAMLIICAAVVVNAKPQQPARDAHVAGTAGISGRVVAAASGVGIPEAVVTATDTASGSTKGATCDYTGAFTIEGLTPGRYVVSSTKATFVTGMYGQDVPGGGRKVVMLENGQTRAVEIRMWKAAVLTGRVVSHMGEPVAGATVNVIRPVTEGGTTKLMPVREFAVTADTGEYRIFGIDPGRYYVVATPPPLSYQRGIRQATVMRPTFYPGADDVSTAQAVQLSADGTLSADIVLGQGRTGALEGTLVDSRGQGPTGGFRIHASAPGVPVQATAQVVSGTFAFPVIAEGEYSFHSDPIRDQNGRPVVFVGRGSVVPEEKLSRVVLVATRPVALSGVVKLPSSAAGTGRLAVRIGAQPMFDTTALGPSPGVSVRRDMSFTFLAWPGSNRIVAHAQGPLQVKSIRVNGIDVSDDAVDLREGVDLDGVEVELTDRIQTVSGTVSTSAQMDGLVEDVAVVVFPADQGLWLSNRRIAIARVDSEGKYIIRSLPPGDYMAAVLPLRDNLNIHDPQFLTKLQSLARPFSLREGSQVSVGLQRQ